MSDIRWLIVMAIMLNFGISIYNSAVLMRQEGAMAIVSLSLLSLVNLSIAMWLMLWSYPTYTNMLAKYREYLATRDEMRARMVRLFSNGNRS